jgi:nucleotide-binding universal stress UspA family protein
LEVHVYANVVTAYDESEGAQAALEVAARLAATDGASLTLVHSVVGPTGMDPPIASKPDPERVAEGRHLVEDAIAKLNPELGASPWIASGPAGEAILAVAKEIGADLIVTGSRGRGRLARVVLGSVSSHLVHNAGCDVLVVHPRG